VKGKIQAQGKEIAFFTQDNMIDFLSLTDIAKYKNAEFPADLVKNWMRSRSTIEFLGLWEQLNNPDFKLVEFDQFKTEAGSNSFVLSPQKWIETTHAKGLISQSGRYGGTFAHKDIAFEFASWVSPEFKLYIIKDYQRLKNDENSKLSLGWDVSRTIAKINYRIQTKAIKDNLLPAVLTPAQKTFTYANEADLLNVALFGKSAKQWRDENSLAPGNIRDSATLQELIVLSNMESMNAELIKKGQSQQDRIVILNKMAIEQMQALQGVSLDSLKRLDK